MSNSGYQPIQQTQYVTYGSYVQPPPPQAYAQGYAQPYYAQPYNSAYPPGVSVVAVPLPAQHLTQEEEEYITLLRLSRTVLLLALLDGCFGLFWVFTDYPYLAVRSLFAPLGYLGAKRFNRKYILAYIILSALWSIGYIAVLCVDQGTAWLALAILWAILEIVILRFLYVFYSLLPTDPDRYLERFQGFVMPTSSNYFYVYG